MRLVSALACLLVGGSIAAGCSSGTPPPPTPAPTATSKPALTVPAGMEVNADSPFPSARCQANRSAGTVVFLTGLDFSASASSVDVYMARAAGYYTALCLDVEIRPSLAVDNYALVAAGTAQVASGGSFGELAEYAGRNEAQFKALAVEGHSVIDTLIVKPGEVPTLESIKGKAIGVKGALSPAINAMLLKAGLQAKRDYALVQLEGFDPKVHIATPDIVGFPGWKSNEPLQLTAAGINYSTFDPTNFGIPGSFGVIYTNATFVTEHPTAAVDFMRATMRGLRDAITDPAAAATEAVKLLDATGNPYSFTAESELARWNVESALVSAGASPESPLGVPDQERLTNEVDVYAKLGVYAGITPDAAGLIEPNLVRDLYDANGQVIWPNATG